MMKHLSRFLLAALLVVPLVACDEDEGPQQPTEVTGTVRGTVTVEGDPQSGITVQLAGAASQSQTTGSDGSFEFSGVPGGSYSVTLSGGIPNGVEFANQSKTTEITSNGQSVTVDFSGSYIRTASISGEVSAGGPVDGATVTLSGAESATTSTDASGEYSFSGLRAGDYTVEVSDLPEGTELSTTSKSVTLSAGQSATVNFSGTGQSTAKVVIERMTAANTNAPINTGNAGGQIDVTLDIDEGNDNVTRAALLVDGEEVAFQTFSSAGATGEAQNVAAAPEQVDGEFQIVFSWSSHAIVRDQDGSPVADENGMAQPLYLDGQRNVTAEISTDNGGESSAQSGTQVTLNNSAGGFPVGNPNGNTVLLSATTDNGDDPNQIIGANELLWYGGDVNVVAMPLDYNGGTVRRVTVTMAGSSRTDTDGSDGFTYTFPEDSAPGAPGHGVMGVENSAVTATASSIFESGEPGPGIGGGGVSPLASGNPFRLDNLGPRFDELYELVYPGTDGTPANPPDNNRWINGEWMFSDQVNGSDDVVITDGGSGFSLDASARFYASTSASDVANEVESALVTSGQDLNESFDDSEYWMKVVASDFIGNETVAWYSGVSDGTDDFFGTCGATPCPAGTGTPSPGFPVATASDERGATSSTTGAVRIGVDKGHPTQSIITSGRVNQGELLGGPDGTIAQIDFQDSRSGFPDMPVATRITRRAPGVSGSAMCARGSWSTSASKCRTVQTGGLFDFSVAASYANGVGTAGGYTEAYYTVEYTAADAAGNEAGTSMYEVLRDVSPPTAGGINFDATLTGGDQEVFSIGVNDNLDLNRSDLFFTFTGAGAIGNGRFLFDQSEIGEFGGDEFSTSTTHEHTLVYPRGIEDDPDGVAVIHNTTGVEFDIYDFGTGVTTGPPANQPSSVESASTDVTTSFTGTGDPITNVTSSSADSDDDPICNDADDDGCTAPTSTTIMLTVMGDGSDPGDGGPLTNLFPHGVRFFTQIGDTGSTDWKQIGTGNVSITEPADASTRTYTYSTTLDAGVFDFPTSASPAPRTYTVYAFGVAADGRMLAESFTIVVDVD